MGVGASRVRDLFSQAAGQAPCIIFIDELDALGKARGMNVFGGNDEREQTLNQLLVEMDGFESNKGVIIMAATNRPEILDPALLRPGRFDRQVLVDRPDINGREAILKIHSKNVLMGPDVDLRKIASLTPGFVGSDLANLVNEAALLAARKNKETVGSPEFDEAIDRVIGGLEKKNRVMNAQEKEIVAFHESGHAIVAESVEHADRVHKISIIPAWDRGPRIYPAAADGGPLPAHASGAARPPRRAPWRQGRRGSWCSATSPREPRMTCSGRPTSPGPWSPNTA